MKLILKDGTKIELDNGNNQNQFVVTTSISQSIEPLLTPENLSDAHYTLNGQIVETIKNKVISGSNRNLITGKVTYYMTDANNVEIELLKTTVIEQEEVIDTLSKSVDDLFLYILDADGEQDETDQVTTKDEETEQEESEEE